MILIGETKTLPPNTYIHEEAQIPWSNMAAVLTHLHQWSGSDSIYVSS